MITRIQIPTDDASVVSFQLSESLGRVEPHGLYALVVFDVAVGTHQVSLAFADKDSNFYMATACEFVATAFPVSVVVGAVPGAGPGKVQPATALLPLPPVMQGGDFIVIQGLPAAGATAEITALQLGIEHEG